MSLQHVHGARYAFLTKMETKQVNTKNAHTYLGDMRPENNLAQQKYELFLIGK